MIDTVHPFKHKTLGTALHCNVMQIIRTEKEEVVAAGVEGEEEEVPTCQA